MGSTDHGGLVRTKPLLAVVVRRRDIDRLRADRFLAAVTGCLEQLAELDVDLDLGRSAVVNQHCVARQQIVLVQCRRVGVIAIEGWQTDLQALIE